MSSILQPSNIFLGGIVLCGIIWLTLMILHASISDLLTNKHTKYIESLRLEEYQAFEAEMVRDGYKLVTISYKGKRHPNKAIFKKSDGHSAGWSAE